MARKGVGRKKIPIRKIENQSNLEVTFSKRRYGVLKKASELSILCNCNVAIIIFSSTEKIHAFGRPSVEQILYKFINGEPEQNCLVQQLMENDRDHELCELNKEIVEYEAIVEAEKSREKAVTELQLDPCDENYFKKWWCAPEQALTLAEAEEKLGKLMEMEHFINSSSKTNTSSSMHTNEVSL